MASALRTKLSVSTSVVNPVQLPAATLAASMMQTQFTSLLEALVELLQASSPLSPEAAARMATAMAAVERDLETARAIEALLDASATGGLVTESTQASSAFSSVADAIVDFEPSTAPGPLPNCIPPNPSLAALLLLLLQ
jgi:hypothetical protein